MCLVVIIVAGLIVVRGMALEEVVIVDVVALLVGVVGYSVEEAVEVVLMMVEVLAVTVQVVLIVLVLSPLAHLYVIVSIYKLCMSIY